MDKFNRTLHGYDPDEVNAFLDQVIKHVERIVADSKDKDVKIKELELKLANDNNLREKVAQYERMESTLNKAIIMAQKTSEQIKMNAYHEGELIVDDAKNNANRIVNEALLKAEKTEDEAAMLRRNINVFKRRLRGLIEEQLTMVDEIDKVEF